MVLSILDAATNDLASLINRLDLEATPATIKGSPIQPLRNSPSFGSLGRACDDSPLKGRKLRERAAPLLADTTASIASLRTFAQTQAQRHPAAPATRQQPMDPLEMHRRMIGQQIAPWADLDWQVSPKRPAQTTASTLRPRHRRAPTPTPEAERAPVFQPLRPSAPESVARVDATPSAAATPVPAQDRSPPSSQTFGSSGRATKLGRTPSTDLGFDDAAPPTPTPRAKRGAHARRPSVLSVMCDTGAALPLEAIKSLGLGGTLGGPDPDVDPHEPGADIPDELKAILASQSDDGETQMYDDIFDFEPRSRAPSPGLPPLADLPNIVPEPEHAPVFRATLYDADEHEADLDEGDVSLSEDDTKKSFDFTGEIRRLSEGGAAHRRSFVEQLENAFRTPARVDLDFTLGAGLFAKLDEAPAPAVHSEAPDEVPHSVTDSDSQVFDLESPVEQSDESHVGELTDRFAKQSFRESATCDTLDRLLAECEQDLNTPYSDTDRTQSSMRSKESDGQLNTSFKFGGRPAIPASVDEAEEDKPLTLSDIIPPFTYSRPSSIAGSSMLGDDSLMKSILGNAYQDDTSVVNSIMAHANTAVPRPRVSSTTSSKRLSQYSADISRSSMHSRNNSELSFQGFESFDEVRRGFEFHPNRPAFYPPPGATTNRGWHNKHESFYSVASVSSYGAVVNSGASDPFGYGPSRPVSFSDDTSMSMSPTVDDTFSFLKKDPRRKRVDSDASSFYFRTGARARGHRRNESGFSVASAAPPISLYNRSFGVHRRNDSAGSSSSAMQGNRSSWARDSIFGEPSPARVARPGLGDKMFEMMDYGMPLPAIAASPTGSVFSDREPSPPHQHQTTNYDSIFDAEPKTTVDDSIFSKTGYKTSYETSDDVFEFDLSRPEQESHVRLRQFRPISMMSMASVHSVAREEDTMISVRTFCPVP